MEQDLGITEHGPAVEESCGMILFRNYRVVPRMIDGVRLLMGAVNELSRLPGIGRKTALRLALHILRQDKKSGRALGEAIINLREGIRYCHTCHNISEEATCPICSNPSRDRTTVCVVENVKDVMAKSVRLSSERPRVISSVYSISFPIDTPRAS